MAWHGPFDDHMLYKLVVPFHLGDSKCRIKCSEVGWFIARLQDVANPGSRRPLSPVSGRYSSLGLQVIPLGPIQFLPQISPASELN